MLEKLFADAPSVDDFDFDAHEAACGESVLLTKLRDAKASDPQWGDHLKCKAIVAKLNLDAKRAARKVSRAAWVAANPGAHAAEQAAIADAKAARNAQ